MIDDHKEFHIREHMRKPLFTYEYKKTAELMVEMRGTFKNIVIVLDEYGATAGLITLEDMLDEVVEASEDVTDLTEELAEMEEETEKQKENLEQTENLTEEPQDVSKGKGALAKLSEEIQEIEEEKQQAVEEEKLAARQARNLEAYQTVDRRYRYQAMDLKV